MNERLRNEENEMGQTAPDPWTEHWALLEQKVELLDQYRDVTLRLHTALREGAHGLVAPHTRQRQRLIGRIDHIDKKIERMYGTGKGEALPEGSSGTLRMALERVNTIFQQICPVEEGCLFLARCARDRMEDELGTMRRKDLAARAYQRPPDPEPRRPLRADGRTAATRGPNHGKTRTFAVSV